MPTKTKKTTPAGQPPVLAPAPCSALASRIPFVMTGHISGDKCHSGRYTNVKLGIGQEYHHPAKDGYVKTGPKVKVTRWFYRETPNPAPCYKTLSELLEADAELRERAEVAYPPNVRFSNDKSAALQIAESEASAPYSTVGDADLETAFLTNAQLMDIANLHRVLPSEFTDPEHKAACLSDKDWQRTIDLVDGAPGLLNMLQRMVDETSGGHPPCLLTLEQARAEIAKANGGAK